MQNENLPIDPAQLDEEWLQQPLLFDQAQNEATECLFLKDNLKDNLEVLKAETADNIRRCFKNYGLEKAPTAPAVTDMVLMSDEVKEATELYNEAQYNLALANNTVRSFDMRKKALEKLTDLHISNYFSVPNPGHLIDGGKRHYEAKKQAVEDNSKKAIGTLNENKSSRGKRKKPEMPQNETIKEGETEAPLQRKRRR